MASPCISTAGLSTVYFHLQDAYVEDSKGSLGSRSVSKKALQTETEKVFRIYEHALSPIIKHCVLGNADIRGDTHVLANFGFSATSPSPSMVKKVKDVLIDTGLFSSRSDSGFSSPVGFRQERGSVGGFAPPSAHPRSRTEAGQAKELRKTKSAGDIPKPQIDNLSLFERGTVICDDDWSLLGNDAFILGGIHGGSTFHLGLKKTPDQKNLWSSDPAFPGPRVFGREILMLCHAGYRLKDFGGANGLCFYKPEGVDTSKVTLESCRAAVKKVENVYQILSIISKATDR